MQMGCGALPVQPWGPLLCEELFELSFLPCARDSKGEGDGGDAGDSGTDGSAESSATTAIVDVDGGDAVLDEPGAEEATTDVEPLQRLGVYQHPQQPTVHLGGGGKDANLR